MSAWKRIGALVDRRVRFIAMSYLLMFGTYVNAATYMQCMQVYQKSLGIPGTPTCAIQVAGTAPMSNGNDDPYNAMNYYNCPNASNWIADYCGGVPVPPQPDDSCPVGDPVLPAKGNVTLSEADFASGDVSPLVFRRTYLSKPFDTAQSMMGRNWVNNWQRRIDLAGAKASVPHIVAYRGNQQPVTFNWSNGAWTAEGNRALSLTKAGDGYFSLKDELLGVTEGYSDTTGRFEFERTRTGIIRKLGYDDRQRVDSVGQWPVDNTAQSSMTISLTYDSSDRITSMVRPSGQTTRYSYDAKGNLASVTQPDGYVHQYLYEDARFPNALTGIKDESGSRTATWTYDYSGRAISVTHPDTTRNTTFSYGRGSATLTDMYGVSTYAFDVLDSLRPRSIATPGGMVTRNWDAAGNLKQRQTPDGDVQYTWDSANRPTRAVATIGAKKTVTTIEYNDGTSLHPHVVATPGKVRAFVYDSSGNVTGYAETQTTDLTGEQGMQAVATGSQLTVGARYDGAGRLLSATVMQDGKTLEDWSYTYDIRGNIATTRDAVSGWQMRTLARDASNRAAQIAGNSGQAGISYDVRGRVSSFEYNEKPSAANGQQTRYLAVQYGYGPDGSVSKRTAIVSTNGGFPQTISDAEIDVWLTNWELGNDPISPPANVTGLRSGSNTSIPPLCVECYMTWKAKLAGKLFGDELSATLPKWSEASELMLNDQSQVPYPTLVPDLTASAKRAVLYGALFAAGGDGGGVVKCSGREAHESECYAQYENDMDECTAIYKPMLDARRLALCRVRAFQRYQTCRGF
jgi:YD repeat-containing protein